MQKTNRDYLPAKIANDNIQLDKFAEKHASYFGEVNSDPETIRYTPTKGLQSPSDIVEWFYADYRRATNEQIYILSQQNNLIGYLTVILLADDKNEIGFVISPEFRKSNYGFLSVNLLCSALFKRGTRKIIARTYLDNIPSQKLLKKIGFQLEGKLRKEFYHSNKYEDLYLYSLFQDELKT